MMNSYIQIKVDCNQYIFAILMFNVFGNFLIWSEGRGVVCTGEGGIPGGP
jgi:hypothetical protein